MKSSIQKKPFQVRIPDELRPLIDEAAKRARWSINTFILAAIEEKLERDPQKG